MSDSFEELAQDCAECAVRWKKRFRLLAIAVWVAGGVLMVGCLLCPHPWLAVIPLVVLGGFGLSVWTEGNRAYERFMLMRQGNLDDAARFKHYQ